MAYQRGILRTVPQHDALFRLIVRDALKEVGVGQLVGEVTRETT